MFKNKTQFTVKTPIVGAFQVSKSDSKYGTKGVLVLNQGSDDRYFFGNDEQHAFTLSSIMWANGAPKGNDAKEVYLTIAYEDGREERITLLCNLVMAQLLIARAPVKAISQEVNIPNDPFMKIKQLKELFDMGAITQEEFDEKKKQLLETI